MNHDEYWADVTAAIERLGVAISSSFMSAAEAVEALRPNMSAAEAVEALRPNDVSGERPKYDPFNARAMWERPCPQKMYREKRPYRMVAHNPVARVKKPRSEQGRRNR